ncbi:MAG: type II secretion system protein GspD [Planctomycetota bacterium]|jgi:hypothetical protein
MKYLRCLYKKGLLVVLLTALALTTISDITPCKAETATSDQNVHKLARNYMQLGMELYERGNYRQAQKYLLFALDYQDYLSKQENQQLSEYLEKTHSKSLESDDVAEDIRKARELFKTGQFLKAKMLLQKVSQYKSLKSDNKQRIDSLLEKIELKLQGQEQEIGRIYTQSIKLYSSGELLKARDGFVKIVESGLPVGATGKTAEDYLAKIDKALGKTDKPKDKELIDVIAEPTEKVIKAEPTRAAANEVKEKAAGGGYIEAVTRRMKIIRGHTRAIVKDATDKARDYINKGEFDKAQEQIDSARRTVEDNQMELGEDLYKHYKGQLNELAETVGKGKKAKAEQDGKERTKAAEQAQADRRIEMEENRKQRVEELLKNAHTYQKQQRYEEALGQIESLLLIEPLHENALIQRDMLEDMINFRKQLEMKKERGEEKVEILKRTDEATIPYADEITYPKNWAEIKAKRTPEEMEGHDAVNLAVYRQLDESVDLTALKPDMTFSDAIEEIKNAVSPPLRIIVMWLDLEENAQIYKTTEINMDPISQVRVGTALNLLLESVSGGFAELGYTVRDGIIRIAIKESLQEELVTRVYDVSILLGEAASFKGRLMGSGRGGGRGGRGGRGGGGAGGGEDFDEYFEEEDERLGTAQQKEQKTQRKEGLIRLIKETVAPDSWFDAGGEGTITDYEEKKLIVLQSRSVHKQIEELLKGLRKSLGEQVSIEARFLVVRENFLQDIGLDIDFTFELGKRFSRIDVQQGSAGTVEPGDTGVPGTLADVADAISISGAWGSFLDDLQVSFILRATQAHRDARSLIAPKVTVLSGESATFRQQRTIRFALPSYTTSLSSTSISGGTFSGSRRPRSSQVRSGTTLVVTPTISPDKSYVLLTIETELTDFLGFKISETQEVVGDQVQTLETALPETEISRVQTRVSVPDRGTLLLGGQKVTDEAELESGVPVLSKIPFFGRAFDNRSKIKDQKILLILLRPTIILQEEKEAEALAAIEEGGF